MSSRRSARSAARGGRCCARSCSRRSSSASSPRSSESRSGSGSAKGIDALFAAIGVDMPRRRHRLRDPDGRRRRSCSARVITLRREPGAGDPRDAGAGDLGRPRGRGACPAAGSRAARPRSRVATVSAAIGGAGRTGRSAPGIEPAVRVASIGFGVAGPVRRDGDAGPAARPAARGACWAPVAPASAAVAGRLARQNALRNPTPHGGDRGGADDRADPGHVRRRARPRAARRPTRRPFASRSPAAT